jgi:hypothetical protein
VDLTIEGDHCSPPRRKLAEAKIYDGPAYHIAGLEQLLGRYTTGREGRGLLIEYVRNSNIKEIVESLRERMDLDLPFQQTKKSEDLTLKWSFQTEHLHSSGEKLPVGHIGCNLHVIAKK